MAKKQNVDNVETEAVVDQESIIEEPVREEPKKKLFQSSEKSKGTKLS